MSLLATDRHHSDALARQARRNVDTPLPGDAGYIEKQYLDERAEAALQRKHTAKVKQTELILFTTQLSVMLDSGVVLSDSLVAIAEQTTDPVFRVIIEDICETVKSGETFSKALRVYPRIFSPMFISMVKASEVSGRMVEMLTVLSGYLAFENETKKRIKGALTYPMIMASLAVVATATLMFFVLPRFMKIYEARGASLPMLTQVLVDISSTLTDPKSLTVIVTCLVAGVAALWYWKQTEDGKRTFDLIKLRTPVVGTMFIDLVITRSMRIMTTMISTGVSLLDAVEVMHGACDNAYFQEFWQGADERIRDGFQLSEAMQISPNHNLISPGIIAMLRAGERSGKLGEVSAKVSDFYEKKLEASIRSVMALIEPLMITILGGIIGTIAIALLLPVFKISSVIAH